MTCNNQVSENTEFEANLKLLKRQAPIEIGHMLRYFKLNVILKQLPNSLGQFQPCQFIIFLLNKTTKFQRNLPNK